MRRLIDISRCSLSHVFMRITLTGLLAVRLVGVEVGYSQDLEGEAAVMPPSFADRKVGVINQLRGLNRSLRELRLQIDPQLPLQEEELTALLQEASLGQLMGQSLEVSLRSTQTLQRRAVDKLSAHPQLLMTLSESLLGVELFTEAITRLRAALQRPNSTPRHFERAMIALFERGRDQLKSQEIIKHWERYLRLCQQLNRTPSPAARYVFAKTLYFTKDLKRARLELTQVTQVNGYQARAAYILGVIRLLEEDWEGGYKIFSDLKQQVDRYLKSSQAVESPPKEKLKVIAKRAKVVVSEIPSTEESAPSQSLNSSGLRAERALSDDLRALLEEVNREESLLQSKKSRVAIGVAPSIEDRSMVQHLQTVLAITLARIALLRGEIAEAWQHYRGVPKGSPLYREGLLEVAYLFKVRKEYQRCAQILELAIQSYPDSEAAFELRLWRAEMLARARKTRSANKIYEKMKRILNQQEQILTSKQKSRVLFAPHVLAWLPSEVSVHGRLLSKQLRELEIWLARAKRDLVQLQRASKARRYPAIEEGNQQVVKTLRQLESLTQRLPRLSAQWRALKIESAERDSIVEVNRGVTLNERAFERFTGAEISASVDQLRQRALRVRQELIAREKLHQNRLADQVRVEERALRSIEARLKTLRAQVTQLSQESESLALERVRGLKAELELGPILIDFWEKEIATEERERYRDLSLRERGPLNQLREESARAPKSLDVLDILSPPIKNYILDPLPDPERDQLKNKR